VGRSTGQIRLHASRATAFYFTIVCALFVAIGSWAVAATLPAFGRASWSLWSPPLVIDLLMSGTAGLFVVALLFNSLYWLVTSSPLLVLDATGMVYRRFAFMRQTIRWADMERVVVVRSKPRPGSLASALPPSPALTLRFTIKPEVRNAYRGRTALAITINSLLLAMQRDEILRLLRLYHQVD